MGAREECRQQEGWLDCFLMEETPVFLSLEGSGQLNRMN